MDNFKKLTEAFDSIGKIKLSDFMPQYPTIDCSQFKIPEFEPINPEDTILGSIKRKIEEQNNIATQQIDILIQQNQLLTGNYDKLKDLYDKQLQAYEESNKELEKTRKYNRWMMLIAILAMLAAIAGPIVTISLNNI